MKLYRYRPLNQFTLNEILKQEWWLSDVKSFNDPFELEYRDVWKLEREEDMPYDLPDFRSKQRKMYNDLDGKLGIVSLSQTYQNILMWSHYADSHKGVCIEYEINEELIFDEKSYSDASTYRYRKVAYSEGNKLPQITGLGESHDFILCTKSNDWRYEKEIRFLSAENNVLRNSLPITKIYVGLRFPKENIHLIKSVSKNIPVCFVSKKKDKYELEEGGEINIVEN